MNYGLGIIANKPTFINDLVIASDGTLFVSDPFGNISTVTGVTGMSNTNAVSMTFLNQCVYMDSGTSTVGVLSTAVVSSTSTWAAGILVASTTPAGQTVPTYCSLAVTWRAALILAMDENNPQNIYSSRTSEPTDWNYAANDPAAAWAANFSNSGQIGEPVTCVIPFNDDLMIVSTVNEIWLIEGSPAQNGSIVRLAVGGGIIGPYAWTIDNAGQLYFVTQAGVFQVMPIWAIYRPPQLISGKEDSFFFEQIDPSQTSVFLQFDPTHKLIQVYTTPLNSPPQHLFLDQRNGGYWPQTWDFLYGPTAALSYVSGVGALALSQIVLIGGQDGKVYFLDRTQTVDANGEPIVAFATFAPQQFSPVDNAVLTKLEIDLGEFPSTIMSTGDSSWNSYVSIVGAPTAATCSDLLLTPQDSTANSTTFMQYTCQQSSGGRQAIQYVRLLGPWFGVTIGNSTENSTTGAGGYFSLERLTLTGAPSGINRLQTVN
jgi:hypothetical protein